MLLNMLMASSVVIIVFAVIFITSYTRVQAENRMRLMVDAPSSRIMQMSSENIPEDFPEIHEQWIEAGLYDEWSQRGYRISSTRISPNAGISFAVVVDADTNILEIDSVIDLTDDTFTRIAQVALGGVDNTETIVVDGRTWQFMASPVMAAFGADTDASFELTYVAGTTHVSTNGYNYLRFVDVTESHQMLQSLALTLIAASLAVLTIFFFISRYFAKQAVKPMEEAWEKQRRFITDASHELKTPLTVINANCGVLYSSEDEPLKDQIKWVDSISRATDRMTGLVGSLLSLASMDDTEQELQNSPFDISQELTTAITEMEVVALEKEITITKTIEPKVTIDSDREQVHKILSTLLDNAVKYTPEGGEITASLTKEKRQIICTIKNSGEGIPADELPNVFDRFYRSDPARSSDNIGYGLGLAIAKAIADKLSIKLSAESEEGEYTEFRMIIDT